MGSQALVEKASGRIVVVGAHTIVGKLAIEILLARTDVKDFWVVDLQPPRQSKSEKIHYIKIDLTEPGADARLAKKFEDLKPDTVIHCALKNNPSLNPSHAHELEVIGTLNVVSASKAAKIRKFIFCSSTVVYGASSKNPNYMDESHPLDPRPNAHFVRDKVEAEKMVATFHRDAPEIQVTVLRFALILGPRAKNYFTELFRRPIVPTLLGYDPLMQFIHEQDAERALEKAIAEDHPGIFNIVGHGVIPLSYALREAGKLQVPVAPFLAYPLVQALWNLQLISVPGKLLDFFRFLWVADGAKAKREMDFVPTFSSKDAFLDFAKTQRIKEYEGPSRTARTDTGRSFNARAKAEQN